MSKEELRGDTRTSLTKDAHNILSFTHGMQQLLISTLYRCFLGIKDLLRLRMHSIDDVLQPLNLLVGQHVEKNSSEPCRAQVMQVRDDEPEGG